MESNQNPDEKSTRQAQSGEWQRDLINRLAFSAITEQRRARRWGIFFKLLTFAYIAGILYLYTPDVEIKAGAEDKHTALVELKGVIAPEKDASADNVVSRWDLDLLCFERSTKVPVPRADRCRHAWRVSTRHSVAIASRDTA